LMSELKLDILFSTNEVRWDEATIPFKSRDATLETAYFLKDSDAVEESISRMKGILDAKHERADLADTCSNFDCLSHEQQQSLLHTLQKHEELFDGTLGRWGDEELHVDLKPDATPCHSRAYPTPRVHEATLRLEVERLCKLGVLKKVNRSAWGAPTFIIPKKDGTVRFITDFRELNKRALRRPHPIPKISDLLLKLEGFACATSLDLNVPHRTVAAKSRTVHNRSAVGET